MQPVRFGLVSLLLFIGLYVALRSNLTTMGNINLGRIFELKQHTYDNSAFDYLANPYMQKAADTFKDVRARELLGDYYFRHGQYAVAIGYLETSDLQRPWSGWQLGYATYLLGDTEEAISLWQATRTVDWLVWYANQLENEEEADRLYLIALQVEPGHEQASSRLALRYATRSLASINADKRDEAQIWLDLAMQLPVQNLTYYQRAAVAAIRLGDNQSALALATQGAHDFPENDHIHYLAASAYEKLGEHEMAIELLQMGIAVSERKWQYQLPLAGIYRRMGRISEARAVYQLVLESDDLESQAKARAALIELEHEE